MAPRREIQDSDDEDSDFSPVKLPDATGTTPTMAPETLKTPSGKNSSSTDSSFFRGIYEKQLQGAPGVPALGQQPIALGDSSEARPSTLSRTENSSSVTDPVMGKRTRPDPDSGELIDLTEVTTPAKPGSASAPDAWDVPSSAEVGIRGGGRSRDSARKTPNSSSKTHGKRKRSQHSSLPDPGVHSLPDTSSGPSDGYLDPPPNWPPRTDGNEDDSPLPAQRKRRKATPQSSAEDHLSAGPLVVPRSEEAARKSSGDANLSSNHAASIVYDTVLGETHGILEVSISQNHMTSSQRRQYLAVSSLEDEFAPPAAQKPLPSSNFLSEENHKSSGTDTVSTVPFGTPSQFRVSEHDHPAAPTTLSPERKRFTAGVDLLPSSPDIIGEPSLGLMKRRAAKDSPHEQPWDSDEARHHRGSYNPRPSRTRSAGGGAQMDPRRTGFQPLLSRDTDELGDVEPTGQIGGGDNGTDPIWIQSSDHEQPDTPLPEKEVTKPQKKRGRKKKENGNTPATTTVPGQSSLGDSATTDPLVEQTEKPKKKRGRPRKSDTAKAATITDASDGIQGAMDKPAARTEPTNHANEEVERQDAVRGKNRITMLPSSRDWSQSGESKKASDEIEELPSSSTGRSGALGAKSGNRMSPAKPSPTPTLSTSESINPLDMGKENQLQEERPGKSKGAKEIDTEAAKSGIASSQSGKVQYRVGLSKRSRIAPLLKSLRK